MPLISSFLQEIARNPHCWLPRLILADYLEERGDLRGELVRLFYELTHPGDEQRTVREARIQDLIQAGEVWPSPEFTNSLGMRFLLLPPGEFLMGEVPGPADTKAPGWRVPVKLSKGFWIGQFAVTQAEYFS